MLRKLFNWLVTFDNFMVRCEDWVVNESPEWLKRTLRIIACVVVFGMMAFIVGYCSTGGWVEMVSVWVN